MSDPNTGWGAFEDMYRGWTWSEVVQELGLAERTVDQLEDENQQLRLRVAYLEDELISQPPSLSKLAWTWWRERRAKRQAG